MKLIIIIIDIIILFIREFFTLALTDGFPLESEWQQVSSDIQDYSQYFGRFQQRSSLGGLHSSSYFQVLQSLYQFFGECIECANYNFVRKRWRKVRYKYDSISI